MWKLSLVLLLAACTQRDRDVCCTTAADCASLGISADKVGSYGCGDGLVCINFGCVAPADAADPDGPAPRCNPGAPWGPLQPMPNVNAGAPLVSMSLTSDELEAFFVRDDSSTQRVQSATRPSLADDFPDPGEYADLALVRGGVGIETDLLPTGDGLVLYFRRQGRLQVAHRGGRREQFSEGLAVTVGGLPWTAGLAGISADGRTLYLANGSDELLYAAPNISGRDGFGAPKAVSTVSMREAVVSADEMTAYYTDRTQVFRSTRTSTSLPFEAGTPVDGVESPVDIQPLAVTADDCVLYVLLGGSRLEIAIARRTPL